jgi:hypothetical protein
LHPRAKEHAFEESRGPLLGSLQESSQTRDRVREARQEAEQRLKEIAERTRAHKPPAPARATVHLPQVRARDLLRTPEQAREAIIASLILGPPKGLEDQLP